MLFSGAGWNVIKVLWGSDWDPLFARDHTHSLLRANTDVDGEASPAVRDRAFLARREPSAGASSTEDTSSAWRERCRSTAGLTRRPSRPSTVTATKATIRTEKQEGHRSMSAFQVARDARIVRTINAAYAAVRGVPQPTGAITPPGYYGTDAGHFYDALGMEGIVCGPGGRYNTMPDERVDIVDYLDMIRIYMLCILDICEPA